MAERCGVRQKGQMNREKIMMLLAAGAAGVMLLAGVVFARQQGVEKELHEEAGRQAYYHILDSFLPMLFSEDRGETLWDYLSRRIDGFFPVYGYMNQVLGAERSKESVLAYHEIIAREAADEPYVDEQGQVVSAVEKSIEENRIQEASAENQAAASAAVNRSRLSDYDYLVQNFYRIDRTTTITSQQLNAQEFLAKDMRIDRSRQGPLLLIYHTHSQEGYADSDGTAATSVMGLGDRLAALLQDTYKIPVLHDRGEYDKASRDTAYSTAAPAISEVLKNNPGIQVVIDLHRDGVAEGTRLVTQVDGKDTAQIMFFNGLSRTTETGDISYLPNPYIQDNLALSLQMQLAAAELYPGFTRPIYLKGYRYNMHLCPKSLLIEVGAQTNTFQEAYNAMEPLAKILAQVLLGD